VERLLIEPARRRPADRFIVAGSLYPADVGWPSNVSTCRHLDPREHPAFYSANRLTLNVTRQAMRDWGYTPSGRLFEAAACATPVLTDRWPGLEQFFEPGSEILLTDGPEEVQAALDLDEGTLARIGMAARERTLIEHTGARRCRDLLEACAEAAC
jgi:spore maturation protein CgeB